MEIELDNVWRNPYVGRAMSRRPSRRHWHCERCAVWVTPRLPHWGWKAAEITAWVVIPCMLFVAHKGPGVVMLPIVCMMAAGLFGPLRGKSHAEPRCPSCARYVSPSI